jgi:hypothetical protein
MKKASKRREDERKTPNPNTLGHLKHLPNIYSDEKCIFCKKLTLEATEKLLFFGKPLKADKSGENIFTDKMREFVFMPKSLISLHHALVNVLEA